SQAVIGENTGSPLALALAVTGKVSPLFDSFFIAPERERQQLFWVGQALEPFDGDKAVDPAKIIAQRGGSVEVIVGATLGRPDLENDGNHGRAPLRTQPGACYHSGGRSINSPRRNFAMRSRTPPCTSSNMRAWSCIGI